ncbi:MAG: outer membrane beta-barrel protein [Flavobacteriales bacterium]
MNKLVDTISRSKTRAKKFRSVFILPILFFLGYSFSLPTKVFAQSSIDSGYISVNVTNYAFSYNLKFQNGTYAVGPTITLNPEGKLSIQFGVLYDVKKYAFNEKRVDNTTGGFYYIPVNYSNGFIPFSLQYNYFNSDKIALYFTAGFMFGGQYTIDNNKARQIGHFNFTCGTGISYRPLNRLVIRAYPTMRFNSGYLFPGFLVDISFLFHFKN